MLWDVEQVTYRSTRPTNSRKQVTGYDPVQDRKWVCTCRKYPSLPLYRQST